MRAAKPTALIFHTCCAITLNTRVWLYPRFTSMSRVSIGQWLGRRLNNYSQNSFSKDRDINITTHLYGSVPFAGPAPAGLEISRGLAMHGVTRRAGCLQNRLRFHQPSFEACGDQR